jgi:hypothetical protein
MKLLDENVVKPALIITSFAVAGLLGLLLDLAWLFLLAVPLFGIPLLREIRVLRDADERETWDHYHSSHLAFYAVMIYVVVMILIRWLGHMTLPYELFPILLIAVAVKLLFGVATVLDQRRAAVLLMALYGVIWLLISVNAGRGFDEVFIFSAGGISVLILAALGWFIPLLGGVLLTLLSITFFFYPIDIFQMSILIEGQLSLTVVIIVPPLVAGWMLINSFLHERREAAEAESGGSAK